MLLRASRKRRGDVSLSDPVGTDGEGNDISFADILGTEAGFVEDEALRRVTLRQVRQIVKTLPKKERLVIEMRYGLLDGAAHPQHEVAAVLGISRSYVSRRHYCKRCQKAKKACKNSDYNKKWPFIKMEMNQQNKTVSHEAFRETTFL